MHPELVVHAWPIDHPDTVLALPDGAEIVRVGYGGSVAGIRLWALVTPDAKTVERRFRVVGTGHPIPHGKLTHLASFPDQDDFTIMLHVFEVA